MPEITTIKLQLETKKRLDRLKVHKRESYNETLINMINILNICRQNPEQARIKLKQLDKVKELSNFQFKQAIKQENSLV